MSNTGHAYLDLGPHVLLTAELMEGAKWCYLDKTWRDGQQLVYRLQHFILSQCGLTKFQVKKTLGENVAWKYSPSLKCLRSP